MGRSKVDRKIVAQLGQPVLREVATPVDPGRISTPEFQEFIDQMHAILEEAGGVGLAAPQVFSTDRIFLAAVLPPEGEDEDPEVETFINPRLTNLSDEMATRWEGCLSFLELLVKVPRHRRLQIDYLNRDGEECSLQLSDFPARVVQHENDHLDGVLTIDRAANKADVIKASEWDDLFGED